MSNYTDKSSEFITGIETEIQKYREKDANVADTLKKQAIDLKNKATEQSATEKKKAEDSYQNLIRSCSKDIIHDFRYVSGNVDKMYISQLPSVDDLLNQAKRHVMLEQILIGRKVIQTNSIGDATVPVYIPWQTKYINAPGNIQIMSDGLYQSQAHELVNDILIRILTAFDPGAVNFTFIDPLKSNAASFFVKSLQEVPNLFYGGVKSTYEEITEHLRFLNRKMEEIQKLMPVNTKSILEYNQAEGKVKSPYEVIVIYDFKELINHANLLRPLINNGSKHGVYLIVLNDKPSEKDRHLVDLIIPGKFINLNIVPQGQSSHVAYLDVNTQITRENSFRNLDDLSYLSTDQKQLVTASNILVVNNREPLPFLKDYFNKVKNIVEKRIEKNKVVNDLEKYRTDFQYINNNFSVPIGEAGNSLFEFKLNESSNTHTFILGKTGSGKSTLLHDILMTAVLKYHPDALNLYLMDFKKGGVEFNEYSNAKVPHLKTALLDDCDRQIVIEILQELANEMTERGNKFQNENVKTLSQYNAKQEDDSKKMPLIILAIDECHLLFSKKHDTQQQTINTIIERIATEGRSQGIHLILATQTLADSSIPEKIMNNISNRFVLRSKVSDAIKLISDSAHTDLNMLTQKGQSIYKDEEMQTLLQPFYVEENEMKGWLKFAREKCINTGISREPLIFSGKQKPKINSVLDNMTKTQSMILGQSIKLSQEAVSLPIHKREGGNSLLIVGNKSDMNPKDCEKNAVRVIVSSILSLITYYKKYKKDYKVYVLNKLDEDENEDVEIINTFEDHSNFHFLHNKRSVEKVMVELSQRIDNSDDDQPDTYFYVLGQQLWRELKNADEIEQPGNTRAIESPQTMSFGLSTSRSNKLTYMSVMEKILKRGGDYGIHVVLQVDKISNLLFDGHMQARNFNYSVLLSMPDMDAERITKNNEIKTESLSSEPERARAYLFNDLSSQYGIFVPFILQKEYVNNIIE